MQLLNRFPRYPLLHDPTKIEPLDRLSDLLKGPRIFVKRDDQNELGGGGNKLRKLEFLIGDARLQLEAVTLLARTEGLLIVPVYGGKAFAGLIAMIRQGHYKKGENILFLMMGGLPGLYAYRSIF